MRIVIAIIALLLAAQAYAAAAAATQGTSDVAHCAAAAPARTGKILTADESMGKGTPLFYGVALTGLAAIVAERDKPLPDPVWCREADVPAGGVTMHVLRNTGEQGDSTPVQRIAADNGATFDVVFSAFGSIGLNKTRNATDMTWRGHLLYGTFNGAPAIYATFDNEPEPQIVASIIAEIVAGTRKPIVHIDEKGVFVLGEPN